MSKFPGDQGYQAFRILQFVFFIAPVIAGLDKFFNKLTVWSSYLSPFALDILKENVQTFMMIVGIVEIIVGLGMLLRPKFFSFVVFVWLLAIVFNLLLLGQYLDVALRDVGLMLSALALWRLSLKYSS